MEYTTSIDIDAPPESVWAVLVDVERWPEWTASMKHVEFVDGDSLERGARVKIRQPGFPPAVWEVTEVEPGRSFTWTNRSPGLTSVGVHRVDSRGEGASTVALSLSQRGAMAPLLRLLTSSKTRRYVKMEAEGLKEASERG